MKVVTGKWITYEVEDEEQGVYYEGNGRTWSRRYGESLETEYDWGDGLIDALEQAVKDYEKQSIDKSA